MSLRYLLTGPHSGLLGMAAPFVARGGFSVHRQISVLLRLSAMEDTLHSSERRMERVGGVEPPSSVWKTDIITVIQYPPALRFGACLPVGMGQARLLFIGSKLY